MNFPELQAIDFIELALVTYMFVFIILLFKNRKNDGRGIGDRVIQFTCIAPQSGASISNELRDGFTRGYINQHPLHNY
jgi:hypothetical protein